MMKKVFLLLFVTAFSFQLVEAQEKLYADKEQSYLKYYMNHPLHSWTGETTDFIAVILTNEDRSEISQVAVTAKISSFDSGNANRDSHTMEVTEALKYPSVSFVSKSIEKHGGRLDVTGNVIFHGVTKSISFEADSKLVEGKLEVSGDFVIKMTDFKIERPTLMGFATDDDIKIEFKTVF